MGEDDSVSASVPEDDSTPKPGVKVVLEKASGSGSQPDIDAIVRGRVNKLNARFDAKAQENNQLTGDLATEKQRNDMLQMQVDQLKSRPPNTPVVLDTPPNPEDFDDGSSDPKYIEALNGYSDNRVSAIVQQQLATAQQAQPRQNSGDAAQRQHYQRAHDSGIEGFEDLEAKAIDVLGADYARVIINTAPNSERIMAYLGGNPEAAQFHKEQIDMDAAKGIWSLASLKLENSDPAATSNPPPNPDTPLAGAAPTTSDDYEKRLAALRKAAGDTGNMAPLMEFKRRHQRPGAAT